MRGPLAGLPMPRDDQAFIANVKARVACGPEAQAFRAEESGVAVQLAGADGADHVGAGEVADFDDVASPGGVDVLTPADGHAHVAEVDP